MPVSSHQHFSYLGADPVNFVRRHNHFTGCFFLCLRFVTRSWVLNVAMLLLWPVSHFLHFEHRLIDSLYFFYVGGLGAILHQSIQGNAWSSRLTALAGVFPGASRAGDEVSVPVGRQPTATERIRRLRASDRLRGPRPR